MRVPVVRYDSGRPLALALLLINQTLKAQAATARTLGIAGLDLDHNADQEIGFSSNKRATIAESR
jgi:hypothetical protein